MAQMVGTWAMPSGNKVRVYGANPPDMLGPDGLIHLECDWEQEASETDWAYYEDVVVPQIQARLDLSAVEGSREELLEELKRDDE